MRYGTYGSQGKAFGKRLKELRLATGMHPQEVCSKGDFSFSWYMKQEYGTDLCSELHLRRIAGVLGLSVQQRNALLGLAGYDQDPDMETIRAQSINQPGVTFSVKVTSGDKVMSHKTFALLQHNIERLNEQAETVKPAEASVLRQRAANLTSELLRAVVG